MKRKIFSIVIALAALLSSLIHGTSASDDGGFRTAEFTPFANVILVAGAWGFKL